MRLVDELLPSEALDDLCQQLEQTTDFDTRLGIWQSIQEVWVEDPQALFLWQRPEFYAFRSDLDWQPLTDFSMAFGPGFYPANE